MGLHIYDKVAFTTEGGIAYQMVNDTGGASIKGYVVQASSDVDNGFKYIVKDIPNPIGVVYEAGIADGGLVWIVQMMVAEVYLDAAATRNNVVRGYLTADGGSPVAGQALSEAFPSSPFASDKHFYEIAHTLESTAGAGLCKCQLHYN